jgi:hypothetical protein
LLPVGVEAAESTAIAARDGHVIEEEPGARLRWAAEKATEKRPRRDCGDNVPKVQVNRGEPFGSTRVGGWVTRGQRSVFCKHVDVYWNVSWVDDPNILPRHIFDHPTSAVPRNVWSGLAG